MKLGLVILNTWHYHTKDDWFGFRSRGGYAPSALRILASLVPKDLDIEIEYYDENIEKINFNLIRADLIAISVLTCNAPRAYHISDDFRKRGIKIVLGGYHVSALPNEALSHCDSVVVGFAEASWPKLLIDFVSGQLKEVYNYKYEESFINHQPLVPNPQNYNRLYVLPNTLEIGRGCYNNCDFCVVPTASPQYVQKHIASVLEEIRMFNASNIVFLDFSPFEDKDYAYELCEALEPLNLKWYSCLSVKNAENEEFIEKAAKSGCCGVLIGFESINSAALNSGNKKFNNPESYPKIISMLHRYNIIILGSFMFGFDEDDRHIFRNTYDFIRDSKIDVLHYSIMTPYPGTKIFKQLVAEDRINTYDWSKYDGTRVVYKPAKMTADELQHGYFEIYKKTHSFPDIIRRMSLDRSNFVVKLATNLGFRLYIHSFIKQYKREKDYLH